jgi:hypothetical protein
MRTSKKGGTVNALQREDSDRDDRSTKEHEGTRREKGNQTPALTFVQLRVIRG